MILFVLGMSLLFCGAGAQTRAPAASATQAMYEAAADRAAAKLQHIRENARRNPPDQTPTVFSQREINAYLASGMVKLPTGVRTVNLIGTPGVIEGTARIDFDEIMAARRSSNPLLSLFSGVHDVHAVAQAAGSGGKGRIHILSVELDGVAIPRVALEFFLDHYIRPKHPEIGMYTIFNMPYRIDLAIVGEHELTITQK